MLLLLQITPMPGALGHPAHQQAPPPQLNPHANAFHSSKPIVRAPQEVAGVTAPPAQLNGALTTQEVVGEERVNGVYF